MKLFQIEEPDGSPVETDVAGLAIGIDASGKEAEIAIAVGGNPAILADRGGLLADLSVPATTAPAEGWQHLFEGARLRAERALARPVSHAVLVLPWQPESEMAARLHEAASRAGVLLLRLIAPDEIARGENRASAAAILAEDLTPPPEAA